MHCAGFRCTTAILIALSSGVVRSADPPGNPATARPPSGPLQAIKVFPAEVNLTGPRDSHRLVVLGEYADGRTWDLSGNATISSSNEKVAVVEGRAIRPRGDGQAVVAIQVQGKSATVPVKVQQAAADIPVSFAREVQPVLTRFGCNQGACHGAQHGRGGFKLSLLGFDPIFDHGEIVQSAKGRRIVVSDPERSILLQKPAGVMEHGGGERIPVNGWAYHLVRQWLADGTPQPGTREPSVARLEVFPSRRLMVPGERQQLLVRANWSDGRTEDVTATAQFDSLNGGIASVTPDGLVTAQGKGESYVMVRFAGQATVMQVTLPFGGTQGADAPRSGAQEADAPRSGNFIDQNLAAKWRELGLTPSPGCSDEEFFRRIYLDAIGTLPAPAEIKAFLADPDPDRRRKAIDRVLDRPEFIDFWTYKWGDLLRIDRGQLEDKGMWSFSNWVRAALRDGKPIDEFVRDIITAEGSTYSEGAANFYRIGRSPSDWAENVAQVFLGIRMQCAKCHHHPFEKWSQDDYYGLVAFFIRVGNKPSQEFGLFGRETVIYLKDTGEVQHPRKGYTVKPHPLDGPAMDDPFDRRRELARWLTAKDNPYFARNIVNRFWGYLMGRGIVEPIDDMRATNPPSNPELLDALAADFAEHRFDLKHLLRTIMNSRAYQLSSQATAGNAADVLNVHYARYTVRRLTAEQLADALDFATGTQEKYPGLPLGTRAIQLPDTQVRSYLLDVFGRPARQITCECERTMQPNIAQALHLLNGDFLNKKIEAPAGRVETAFKVNRPVKEIIDELYLVTVSRPPRAEELARAEEAIRRAPTPREGVHDLLWVLLNSREFLFQH